jgi:hypothetical protein
MNAGKLRDWLVFERRVVTDLNNGGGSRINWVNDIDFSTWGSAERTTEQNARFIRRYREGIGPSTYRIIWGGAIWLITSAVHDDRRTMLTIDSDFSALVEVTTILSTEREYIEGIPTVRPSE